MYVGFSTATTAMSGQKQTLMLQLFTGTYDALPSAFRRAYCMPFYWALPVTPTAQCTDLLSVSLGKDTRNMWLQNDRTAAHFARQIREHLTATYCDHWDGRGGPVA